MLGPKHVRPRVASRPLLTSLNSTDHFVQLTASLTHRLAPLPIRSYAHSLPRSPTTASHGGRDLVRRAVRDPGGGTRVGGFAQPLQDHAPHSHRSHDPAAGQGSSALRQDSARAEPRRHGIHERPLYRLLLVDAGHHPIERAPDDVGVGVPRARGRADVGPVRLVEKSGTPREALVGCSVLVLVLPMPVLLLVVSTSHC